MPLYEYQCVSYGCGNRTELRRSIEARNDPVICPNCGRALELVVSVPAVAQVRGGTGAQRYDAGKR